MGGPVIWFGSDFHYGHANIVRGISKWTDTSGCRQFDTLAEHDDWLVDSINAKVQPQDTLWHLGDWSFGGLANVSAFRCRLRCEDIHVLYGNHDHHIQGREECWALFASHQHYLERSFGKLSVVLSHYPIESWNNMHKGAIHLHGHVHGNGRKIDGRYDVGMDALGLLSLDQVRALPRATTQHHPSIEGGNTFGT